VVVNDVRTAKLVNWCQGAWERYWTTGDPVNGSLVFVWLQELTGGMSRFYPPRVPSDANPFPRFRLFRWLP